MMSKKKTKTCGGAFFLCNIGCQDQDMFFRSQWLEHQQDTTHVDLEIQAGKGYLVSIHQAVLAPLSPFLTSTLQCLQLQSSSPPLILIPDYNPVTLKALVDLIYTGRCVLENMSADYGELLSLIQTLGLEYIKNNLNLKLDISEGYPHKKFKCPDRWQFPNNEEQVTPSEEEGIDKNSSNTIPFDFSHDDNQNAMKAEESKRESLDCPEISKSLYRENIDIFKQPVECVAKLRLRRKKSGWVVHPKYFTHKCDERSQRSTISSSEVDEHPRSSTSTRLCKDPLMSNYEAVNVENSGNDKDLGISCFEGSEVIQTVSFREKTTPSSSSLRRDDVCLAKDTSPVNKEALVPGSYVKQLGLVPGVKCLHCGLNQSSSHYKCHTASCPLKPNPRITRSQRKVKLPCPLCGEVTGGGSFKLKSHLVDKHFYTKLSAQLGPSQRQCPVCRKYMDARRNLIKHIGIKHNLVGQMLKEQLVVLKTCDINGNNDNTKTDNYPVFSDDKNVVATPAPECKDEFYTSYCDEVPRSHSLKTSSATDSASSPCPSYGFKCSLCIISREFKSRYHLLRHYSAVHFRDKLEKDVGHQLLVEEGQCALCGKRMKSRYLFVLHIGAVHQKVLKLLHRPTMTSTLATIRNRSFSCSFPACSDSIFPTKSTFMRHLSVKHFHKELVDYLRPMFDVSNRCVECGKVYPLFQNYMMHSAMTHRLVFRFYGNNNDVPIYKQ
jgi:hypothetical protein